MALVSDCCGAYPKGLSEEVGICPDCKEHCEYVEEDEDEEEPKPLRMTCRIQAAMKTEPNGDRYVND